MVFDAFSAANISLYGYERDTTPNLRRVAKQAIVYHNHYAGSNFTTSGTASLLTGTLPWTNRALQANGQVAPAVVKHNIFELFQDYYRISYTHNSWAFTLLHQFRQAVDELIPPRSLFLTTVDNVVGQAFQNDDDLSTLGWIREMNLDAGNAYSLFMSHILGPIEDHQIAAVKGGFPRGLPTNSNTGAPFLLDRATDWVKQRLPTIPRPFFGYFHFLPPHGPYRTSREFFRHFAGDGLLPIEKPVDLFTDKEHPSSTMGFRTPYDEYILYADKALGALYDWMEASGILETTWVVITSDHGEMFERGMVGHGHPSLYQPVIHIPLLILQPGERKHMDIHTPTSAVDVMATLAHLTGHPVPNWTEGAILPPFAETGSGEARNIYAVLARNNDPSAPLIHASTALIRDPYKLLYYFGYPEFGVDELVKVYDLRADPEEMVDLASTKSGITADLLHQLKSRLAEVDRPYL